MIALGMEYAKARCAYVTMDTLEWIAQQDAAKIIALAMEYATK
jgi:hypothetical protein